MIRVPSIRIAAAGLSLVLALAGCESRTSPPRLEPALQATLAAWLADHGQTPTDYVVGLFAGHDVVFLGELHRVKHDVLLVQSLFRPLYQAGVRTFAMEFARREDQSRIDSLLAAPEWTRDSRARSSSISLWNGVTRSMWISSGLPGS